MGLMAASLISVLLVWPVSLGGRLRLVVFSDGGYHKPSHVEEAERKFEAAQSVLERGDMAEALPLCYHGAISKKAGEDLLGQKNKDGAYLIRNSETIQGAMCLCVYKGSMIYTYRLLKTHHGEYTLSVAEGVKETFFRSLEDLIRHYKRRNQGLAMHLCHAVKRKTTLLKQPVCHAETQGPVCLPEQQCVYDDPDHSDYVKVLPY